jgi:hypothetical protein
VAAGGAGAAGRADASHRRVWVPGDENDPAQQRQVSAFTQALAGLGWTDGRNVRMDLRWPVGDINRIRSLAEELVGLQPDIIVASGTPATAALRRETRTIPVVFVNVTDPVASGLVARAYGELFGLLAADGLVTRVRDRVGDPLASPGNAAAVCGGGIGSINRRAERLTFLDDVDGESFHSTITRRAAVVH